MSQTTIENAVLEFQEFMDESIRNNKPVGKGTKGTQPYVQSKLLMYGEMLSKCDEETTERANEILKDFSEDYAGEGKILKEQILKLRSEIKGKFKKEHWR